MKIELRDRTKQRDAITGRSLDNMVRRMYGTTAWALGPVVEEPFTVVHRDGRILGTAIYYEVK